MFRKMFILENKISPDGVTISRPNDGGESFPNSNVKLVKARNKCKLIGVTCHMLQVPFMEFIQFAPCQYVHFARIRYHTSTQSTSRNTILDWNNASVQLSNESASNKSHSQALV